jgi:hypothetical protein
MGVGFDDVPGDGRVAGDPIPILRYDPSGRIMGVGFDKGPSDGRVAGNPEPTPRFARVFFDSKPVDAEVCNFYFLVTE